MNILASKNAVLSLKRNVKSLPLLSSDCDVETPKAHLYLKPIFANKKDGSIQILKVDMLNCTGYGRCAEVLGYKAITVLN